MKETVVYMLPSLQLRDWCQKIFTVNYFHMNIFNNEFFPNYDINKAIVLFFISLYFIIVHPYCSDITMQSWKIGGA